MFFKTTVILSLAATSLAADTSACYTYKGDGDDISSLDARSSLAGRISLQKRGDNFQTFNSGKANACSLAKELEIPRYPQPPKLGTFEAAGAKMWWVMTETSAAGTCPVLGYTQVSDTAVTSHRIASTDTTAYTKGGNWKRTSPAVNVDHVFELTILKQYIASRITAQNCADFKSVFDVADQGNAGVTRLQTLWNQLPSETNPEFAGMDTKLNAIKAQAFTGSFTGKFATTDDAMGYLQQMALAIKLTNDATVSALFKKTNDRVYAALQDIDAVITAELKSCPTSHAFMKADWASTYKTWVQALLTESGTKVNRQIASLLNNKKLFVTDANGALATPSISNAVAAFQAAYPTPAAFTLDQAKLLAFTAKPLGKIKRSAVTTSAGAAGSACALPSKSSSGSSVHSSGSKTASVSATATATATHTSALESSSSSTAAVIPPVKESSSTHSSSSSSSSHTTSTHTTPAATTTAKATTTTEAPTTTAKPTTTKATTTTKKAQTTKKHGWF